MSTSSVRAPLQFVSGCQRGNDYLLSLSATTLPLEIFSDTLDAPIARLAL